MTTPDLERRARDAAMPDQNGYRHPLSDLLIAIADALSSARAVGREEAAKECDAQAHVEDCADDTARGHVNAAPYRKMAARIRALASPPSDQIEGNVEHFNK